MENSWIQIGNKDVIQSMGYGTIKLDSVVNGVTHKLELKNVLYVSDIMYNFILLSVARKNGFRIIVDEDSNGPRKGTIELFH